MIYVECQHDGCPLEGAVYSTAEMTDEPTCASCGSPLVEVTEPAAQETPPPEERTPDDVLADERQRASSTVIALLSDSDVWCARQVEDGVSLTPARITYREQLRATLATIATSNDPASVPLPDPPPAP